MWKRNQNIWLLILDHNHPHVPSSPLPFFHLFPLLTSHLVLKRSKSTATSRTNHSFLTLTTTKISVPGRDMASGPFFTSLPNHPRNSTPRASGAPTPTSTSTTHPGSLPLTPHQYLLLSSSRKTLPLLLLSGLTLLFNRTPITAVTVTLLMPLLLWSVRY
ncbi:hypothetical protein V8G54_016409 [Vigna mungo]|uniref:Uncharacterized protein n=1 Tax=Vigna mungo TaxID=3915 RepID=A0AAQ3NK52_VIGMU